MLAIRAGNGNIHWTIINFYPLALLYEPLTIAIVSHLLYGVANEPSRSYFGNRINVIDMLVNLQMDVWDEYGLTICCAMVLYKELS